MARPIRRHATTPTTSSSPRSSSPAPGGSGRGDVAAHPRASSSGRRKASGAGGGLTRLDGYFLGGSAIAGVAILAIAFLGGGSGETGPSPPSSTVTTPPITRPENTPREKTAAEKKRDVQVEYLRNSATIQSAAGHLQLADWCEKAGLPEERIRELERAALKDPDGRDGRVAHEKLGHVRYEAPIDLRIPELAPYLGRYLTKAEVAEADAIVAAAREKAKEIAAEEAKDPWLKNARGFARTNLLDPAMKNFHLTVSYHRPYVVFVESDSPIAGDGALATGEAIPLSELGPELQRIHEEHGQALAANLRNYVDRYAHVIHNYEPEKNVFLFFSFQTRKSFEAYQKYRDPRANPESFLRAYYIPKTREVISFLREQDGAPMTTPVHVVCHEAIHQLTHHFEKGTPREKEDNPVPGSYWFQEGFAEYLSPSSDKPVKDPVTGEPTYDFCGLLRGRLFEYSANKKNGVVLTLQSLIRNDQGQAISELFETLKNSPLSDEKKREIASVGFYGHAWFFVHFLNHYSGGKYKEAFDIHLSNELNGEASAVKFIRALGIQKWDEKEKFDRIQEEMDEYLTQLLK